MPLGDPIPTLRPDLHSPSGSEPAVTVKACGKETDSGDSRCRAGEPVDCGEGAAVSDKIPFRMKVHSSDVRKGCQFTHVMIPAECEKFAWRNHSQTLARLNERGGMGITEMAWLLRGYCYGHELTDAEAMEIVTPYIEAVAS